MNPQPNKWRGGKNRGNTPSIRSGYTGSQASSNQVRPVIQVGGKTLVNKRFSDEGTSKGPSINLQDISPDSPLYELLQQHIAAQSSPVNEDPDSYVNMAKDRKEDVTQYEKLEKREIIFCVEDSDIQRQEDPWKLLQRYLINNLFYPGDAYKDRLYYENILKDTGSADIHHTFKAGTTDDIVFSKIVIKKIMCAAEWGISTQQIKNMVYRMGGTMQPTTRIYTYWDYIQAFHKVLYLNNMDNKHTWFIKTCPKLFDEMIPNWFIQWWTLHGPSVRILPEQFKILYNQWQKFSSDLERLYRKEHMIYPERIDNIYFFMEFSIPWIHKWEPEFGYTEEQIPCLFRIFYNRFWEKMMKVDKASPSKAMHGQTTIDIIQERIKEYSLKPDQTYSPEVKFMARKITSQGNSDKTQMIEDYLNKIKDQLMKDISNIEETTSTKSGDSIDVMQKYPEMFQDAQDPNEGMSDQEFAQKMYELNEVHDKMTKKAQGKKTA